jgi:hypothetical protein
MDIPRKWRMSFGNGTLFQRKKASQVTNYATRCIISFLAVAPEKTAVSAQFKFSQILYGKAIMGIAKTDAFPLSRHQTKSNTHHRLDDSGYSGWNLLIPSKPRLDSNRS